jgi:hypothetical protein
MFDWLKFLDTYRIEYVMAGPNIGRNNAGIKCPFCGDDPSFHLGISLDGKGFHCWREPSRGAHSGRSPHKLVMRLLGCSFTQAQAIVGDQDRKVVANDSTFDTDIKRRMSMAHSTTGHSSVGRLELLPEFKKIPTFTEKPFQGRGPLVNSLFIPYLRRRGYSIKEIDKLVERFDLHYALTGKFAYRLIIPVFMDGKLVNWTGRAVTTDTLRYKTLSHDMEVSRKADLPPAPMNVKDCLFDYDDLKNGGDILVLTEGPFDAMRITFFGEKYGIMGTCLFGKGVSKQQKDLLYRLLPLYDHVHTFFDTDVGLASTFSWFPDDMGIVRRDLPKNVKDPAELQRKQFTRLFDHVEQRNSVQLVW